MTQLKILLVSQIIESSNYQDDCIAKRQRVIEKRFRSYIRKEQRKRGTNSKRNNNVPEVTKVTSFIIEQAH